ncbi:MAG: hypothetical protein ABF651_05620 [Sporolactobacillus sp.]
MNGAINFTLSHPIFPITYLSGRPFAVLAAFLLLFVLDGVVLLLSLRFFDLKLKKPVAVFVRLWLADLCAYLFGSLFVNLSLSISEQFSQTSINSFQLYSSATGVLVTCLAILLSSSLIYWLGLSFIKKSLTLRQRSRLALTFALFTAPYIFLIPSNWF